LLAVGASARFGQHDGAVRDDGVAAAPLGGIERDVRRLDQMLGVLGDTGDERRDADADRDLAFGDDACARLATRSDRKKSQQRQNHETRPDAQGRLAAWRCAMRSIDRGHRNPATRADLGRPERALGAIVKALRMCL
jgi:hypothetical protein